MPTIQVSVYATIYELNHEEYMQQIVFVILATNNTCNRQHLFLYKTDQLFKMEGHMLFFLFVLTHLQLPSHYAMPCHLSYVIKYLPTRI